jgi:hypothetical protein
MEIEDLVERLAAIEVEAHFDDPERLLAAMTERQAILTSLQNTDTQSLSEERCARMKDRLRAVLVRNNELVIAAGLRLEEMQKSMQQLAPGRAAARGYGEPASSPPPALRRIG